MQFQMAFPRRRRAQELRLLFSTIGSLCGGPRPDAQTATADIHLMLVSIARDGMLTANASHVEKLAERPWTWWGRVYEGRKPLESFFDPARGWSWFESLGREAKGRTLVL